jgi:hypothetical protein
MAVETNVFLSGNKYRLADMIFSYLPSVGAAQDIVKSAAIIYGQAPAHLRGERAGGRRRLRSSRDKDRVK